MTALVYHYARLRECSVFATIFALRMVPIESSAPEAMAFEGSDEIAGFLVDLERCTGAELEKVVCLFHAASGEPKAKIRAEILSRGLPIRASQVESVTQATGMEGDA